MIEWTCAKSLSGGIHHDLVIVALHGCAWNKLCKHHSQTRQPHIATHQHPFEKHVRLLRYKVINACRNERWYYRNEDSFARGDLCAKSTLSVVMGALIMPCAVFLPLW